jgi:hypothetical protein
MAKDIKDNHALPACSRSCLDNYVVVPSLSCMALKASKSVVMARISKHQERLPAKAKDLAV